MDAAAFREAFLPGEELTRFVCFMCNAMTNSVTDPITHTLHIMITRPLSLVLTQVGIAPFKGESTAIYPYRVMTDEQKECLREGVRRTRQEVAGAMASVQIGGGCILYTKRREGQPEAFLSASDVLGAFCCAVFQSKTHTDARVRSSICNLFVQRSAPCPWACHSRAWTTDPFVVRSRVSSLVNMDRSVVRQAEEHIRSLAAEGCVAP